MYCSGFVVSFGMKVLNRVAGRKISYLLGAAVGLGASIWVYWGDTLTYHWFKYTGIYFAAVMFGAAGCAVLVTSLSLTAELIGPNTESAAFVYGAMSFTDKVSNGLAVMVIQDLIPCIKCCPLCKWYFRWVAFDYLKIDIAKNFLSNYFFPAWFPWPRWRQQQVQQTTKHCRLPAQVAKRRNQ